VVNNGLALLFCNAMCLSKVLVKLAWEVDTPTCMAIEYTILREVFNELGKDFWIRAGSHNYFNYSSGSGSGRAKRGRLSNF